MTAGKSRTSVPALIAVMVMLLTIPFMRVDFPSSVLPKFFSDFSWGMMLRLGVCFGPVILVWCWGIRGESFNWRSALFLVASVASAEAAYAAVFPVPQDFAVPAVVVTGALLLSLSQTLILKSSWAQMLTASISAPVVFYLVTYGIRLLPINRELVFHYWPYYWQVGYLLGMFVIPDFSPTNSAT